MEDDGLFRLQRLLSKKNNHKVFRSLHEGLKPDEQALKRLGLGKRAFYYSIRELRQSGLAAKREGKFVLTPFGYFVYSVQDKLTRWLSKDEEIRGLTELLSNENGNELSYILLKDIEEMVGLSNFEPIRVYTEWSALSSDLALLIKAKRSIKIATRHSEPTIVKYLYQALVNGVEVESLSDKAVVAVRAASLPYLDNETMSILKSMLSMSNLKMRVSDVPFSFILIDREEIGIEIPNPISQRNLLVAFRFKSPIISEKLEVIFNQLFSGAQIDPVYSIIGGV
ncbi:MAG: hypothetical protein ACP5NC_02655 [Nitrososphaeria archaeon]